MTKFAVTIEKCHGMAFTSVMTNLFSPFFTCSLRFAVAFTEELKREAEMFLV